MPRPLRFSATPPRDRATTIVARARHGAKKPAFPDLSIAPRLDASPIKLIASLAKQFFTHYSSIPSDLHYAKGPSMAGEPHTNRLIDETSPYLLQHAHPIRSIGTRRGLSTRTRARGRQTHTSFRSATPLATGVHVMEHDSFENEDIARLMNDNFVCIKSRPRGTARPRHDVYECGSDDDRTWRLADDCLSLLLTEAVLRGHLLPPADRHGLPGFPKC